MTDPTPPKKLTVITAGSAEWEPSGQELQELVNVFMSAKTDPVGAVMAFRPGIQVRQIEHADDQALIAASSWLSDKDIEVCTEAFRVAATSHSRDNLGATIEDCKAAGVEGFREALDKRLNGD